MKKNSSLAFVVLLFVSNISHALDIAWQATMPFSPDAFSVLGGPDGATTVTNNNVIYWYSSVGTLQYTIDVVSETGITPGIESFQVLSCSNSTLVVKKPSTDYNDTATGHIIVFTLSGGSLSNESVVGTAVFDEEGTGAKAKYLVAISGTTLTAYHQPNGLSVTSNSGISMVPNNAVVIPSSYQGNVEIILETSNDLVEWTPALPGTYNPATSSRFFRVRAESAE